MKKNGIKWTILFAAAMLLCAACIRQRAEAPSEVVGVGRAPKTESRDTEAEPVTADPGEDRPVKDGEKDPAGQGDPQPQTGTDPAPQQPAEQPTEPDEQPTEQPAEPDELVTPSEPAEPVTTPEPEEPTQTFSPTPMPTDPSSEAPFGAIKWYSLNGSTVYEMPQRNTSGMDTMGEMYDWPDTYWEDKNKKNNDWYFGELSSYDPVTGKVEMRYDRFASTLAVLKKYGAIYRGDTTRKVIYLTFDCGYEYGSTEKILDTLKARGVPATFFLTGPFVRGKSDLYDYDYMHNLVRRMLDEGHVVGSHTNTHPLMSALSVDEIIDEMRQVEASYKEEFPDAPDMLYWRPPQGDVNERVLRITAKMGYRTVMWSFAYFDWSQYSQPDPAEALAKMKAGMYPGCVYLLHAESSTNAEVLGDFIDWVHAQGFVIEPICGIE
ncbi:MAG: polysaccharide deacetylase family protein [Clostridia bacterium]|nr:polysaccharide deacetylase family protein [Clostridia bacterium]